MRLTPEELHRLQAAHLVAEEKALEAQLARNRVRAILLDLDRTYGTVGSEVEVDVRTGLLRTAGEEVWDGPGDHEGAASERPA